MKKEFIRSSTVLLALLATLTFRSATAQLLEPTFNELESIRLSVNADTRKLISGRGLNLFFAKKVSFYLSGSQDLSLYKNYATLSSEDGRLFIGHNFSWPKDEDRIKSLTTVGIKANVVDQFATLFSDKEFNNDIGLNLKQTFFFPGTVFFTGGRDRQPKKLQKVQKWSDKEKKYEAQREIMNKERQAILGVLHRDMFKDERDLELSIVDLSNKEKEKRRNDFVKKRSKYYHNTFAQMEADKTIELEQTAYNMAIKSWFSIEGYLPFTRSTSLVGDSLSTLAEDEFLPWNLSASFNIFIEGKHKVFLSAIAGILNNNSIKIGEMSKKDRVDYTNDGGTDEDVIGFLKDDDGYTGAYEEFVSGFIKGQLVFFPSWLDFSDESVNVGLSGYVEQFIGNKYEPLNIKLGIPVRLSGKDEDNPINVELSFRANDINQAIDKDKNFGERITVGISIGLPFASVIY